MSSSSSSVKSIDQVSDRYQNDEEDLRLICAMSGVARGYISAVITKSRPPSSSSRHFPRPHVEKATYLHGVYGRQSVPVDEGPRSQMHGWQYSQEHTVSVPLRLGPYTRP